MLRTFILLLNTGSALLLVCTYIIPYLNPLEIRKIPLLGLFYPFLILSNLLFIVGWIFTKKNRQYALISLVAIILGSHHWGSMIGTCYFNTSATPVISGTTISSYNIKNFDEIAIGNRQFRPDAVKNIFKHLGDSQYLCAQEVDYDCHMMLLKELKFPHSFGIKGTMIFSKLPFIETGQVDFENSINSCSWVDVPVNDKIVRLYNVHLESNHITNAANIIIDRKKYNLIERFYLLKNIFGQYAFRSRKRVQQTDKLLQHISESPYPVIVCGDFNDSPISYIYNRFTNQLTDGFLKQGKGLGFSFRGNIPFLRIDYILADSRLHFQNYQTVKDLTYSDHFPVTADIVVP